MTDGPRGQVLARWTSFNSRTGPIGPTGPPEREEASALGRCPHSVGHFASAVGHTATAHRRGGPIAMRDGYLRGVLSPHATQRQVDVLAAYVGAGGSVSDSAALMGIRPSTAKRHLADLRARSGLTTEQLIYRGRAEGWLVVPSLEGIGRLTAGQRGPEGHRLPGPARAVGSEAPPSRPCAS